MKRAGIITAVVVALVAATLAGLWWGHHTTTSSSTTPTPTTTKATTPASQVPAGTVVAGEGGSLPGPGTLKLGYTHTPDGAVAAITNYVTAANDKTNLASPAYRTALVNAIALDESSKAGLSRVVDLAQSASEGYGVWRWEPRRGAYAIRAYSTDHAEVALWTPYYWAEPTKPTALVGSAWGISVYAAEWSGGDWKVNSLGGDLVADDGGDLTALANPAENPSSAEKAAILTTPRGGTVRLWALQWMEYANAAH
jgi:hypothetical protein